MRHTRLDDKVSNGCTITPDYEAMALLSNDNGGCSLFFMLLLR